MDVLVRIFYTVLSLGIVMVFLLPVVLLVRFLLRHREKRAMMWEWRILYLRSICPVALTSIFCPFPSLNRRYHMWLDRLGLTIEDHLLMDSWRAVYTHDVTATSAFQICSIVWAAGVLLVFFLAILQRSRYRRFFKSADPITDEIAEQKNLPVPTLPGLFRKKIYLPQGFGIRETKWMIYHAQAHQRDGIGLTLAYVITAVSWFNPVMWLYFYWCRCDTEFAADDRTVRGLSEEEKNEYAQSVLNFSGDRDYQSSVVNRLFFLGVEEDQTARRAGRLLQQKKGRPRGKFFSALLVLATFVFCFFLTPLAGAFSDEPLAFPEESTDEKRSFAQTERTVVTRMGSVTPSGLAVEVTLEMTDGVQTVGGYEGNFAVVLYDAWGTQIDSYHLLALFPTVERGKQSVALDTTLCITDYNGDNAQELVIGLPVDMPDDVADAVTGDEVAYVYAVLGIEEEKLSLLAGDILAVAPQTELANSVPFDKEENNAFCVPYADKNVYYIWDSASETYTAQEMTQEEFDTYTQTRNDLAVGQTQTHELTDSDGNTAVSVDTETDETGSESIVQTVLFSDGKSDGSSVGLEKIFDDIAGYYCDLVWVADANDRLSKRYAQVIYNGTRAQTFVIYDTKNQKEYYRQEDGTGQLSRVFSYYGEEDIEFESEDAAIYSLTAKNEDVLSIQFAASVGGVRTVNGNFDYDVKEDAFSNLSFSVAE